MLLFIVSKLLDSLIYLDFGGQGRGDTSRLKAKPALQQVHKELEPLLEIIFSAHRSMISQGILYIDIYETNQGGGTRMVINLCIRSARHQPSISRLVGLIFIIP